MPNKEIYAGTSYTEGITSRSYDSARMYVHVTGLDGTRSSLDTAVSEATANRLVHPDNASLPLKTATAVWHRGADGTSNAEAIVILTYSKGGRSAASSLDVMADITVRYDTIEWFAPTLQEPEQENGEAEVVEEPDYSAGDPSITKIKRWFPEVVIWDIYVPVVLATSPVNSVADTAGKVNSSVLTLSGKSFAEKTIRFNGLTQRATRIASTGGVAYEFDVRYSFSYRADGWYKSELKEVALDGGIEVKATKTPMYDAVPFPTFPV